MKTNEFDMYVRYGMMPRYSNAEFDAVLGLSKVGNLGKRSWSFSLTLVGYGVKAAQDGVQVILQYPISNGGLPTVLEMPTSESSQTQVHVFESWQQAYHFARQQKTNVLLVGLSYIYDEEKTGLWIKMIPGADYGYGYGIELASSAEHLISNDCLLLLAESDKVSPPENYVPEAWALFETETNQLRWVHSRTEGRTLRKGTKAKLYRVWRPLREEEASNLTKGTAEA